MDYLKKSFVIEGEDGSKEAVTTFRQFVKLNTVQKQLAREFQRDGQPISLGQYSVRKHEAFELV